MEFETEATVEERTVSEKSDVEESSTEGKKDEQNVGSKVKGASKLKETKSEAMASKAFVNVSKSKISKLLKEPRNSKNSMVTKDNSNKKTAIPFSGSLSLRARRVHGDVLMKSIDEYQEKTDIKHSQDRGSRVQALSSNGSVPSLSSLNHPNRRVSINLDSKPAATNGGRVTARRTTLASLPSSRKAVPAKSGPGNVAAKSPPSSESINSKPITAALQSKEDDDAHSITSTRRSSGSGFTFRSEERAEKRKEFFSKLEEKIHAKEMEKSNFQAKSKENQEAEIKKLRKSLTFKATPMPIFYKEPPPKVDLKKIPTTRAISPKFGRQKGSVAATNNPSEGDDSSVSSSLNVEQNGSTKRTQTNGFEDDVVSKEALRKSQPMLQSKEVNKAEEKPGKSKPKTRKAEKIVEDACVEKPEENQQHPQCKNAVCVAAAEKMNPAKDDGPIPCFANPEIMPRQVTVGG